ncbi:MAG TPA: cytochrome c [Gammaproteobacteria bacterium]|nr:cytochrome c [Gammaproteobacteria bacterium]
MRSAARRTSTGVLPAQHLVAAALLCAWSAIACAQPAKKHPPGPNLGVPATAAQVAGWDVSIAPDGAGLPPGSGTAMQGAAVYAAKCIACHGEKGAGRPNDQLVGGVGSIGTSNPVRTVGSYWPYATTLFDYIRRAMPVIAPQSLSNDEVYALTAYLLALNGVIEDGAVMNASTLPRVTMPNRDNFVWAYGAAPKAGRK